MDGKGLPLQRTGAPYRKEDDWMIAVICDRCGAQVPASGKIGYMSWGFRAGLDGDLVGGNVLEERHYCQACMDSVMECINAAPGHPGGGTAKKPGKKRVDAGKVLALKKAGWNAKRIAEDMGVSLQAVYKVLHDHEGDA